MFTQNKCIVLHCRNNALSTFDEMGNLTEKESYCLDHIPNPGKLKEDIYKYIESHDTIVGLNASGLVFENLDLSNKKFFGCNFSHCTFTNVHSQNIRIKMCIFDFSLFNNCNLIQSNIIFTSFSGSTFTHTLFTESNLIQNGFNGIKAFQSCFDGSDLYNSRFIQAMLVDTSFQDCNIKKVLFYDAKTREAVFSQKGSALALGEDPDEDLNNSTTDGVVL